MSYKPDSLTKSADNEQAPDIRALQSMAAEAAASISRKKSQKLSRRAQLFLIDYLSRMSGAGLGLIGGVAVFLAVTVGRSLPLRAAIWMAIVAAALYVARRSMREFRAGKMVSAKPFRWRANYGASIMVLGGAFGAGAWLLFPTTAAHDILVLAIIPVTIVLAAGAHAPHFGCLMALGASGLMFSMPAIYRSADVADATAVTCFALAGIFVGAAISLHLRKDAAARFPRTSNSSLQVELLEPEHRDSRKDRRNIAS